MKKRMSFLIALIFAAPPIFAEDKLIFAASLIRHGDRTPISNLPTSPYPWREGLGQLTPLGMQQEYQLGQRLRAFLIQEKHLLPEHYQQTTLYVRSDDVDRTLMSAESLLYGLYPLKAGPKLPNQTFALPEGFQPIPIHTVRAAHDFLLHPSKADPAKADALFLRAGESNSVIRENLKKMQPLQASVLKTTGLNVSDAKELVHLGDDLFIRKLHGVSFPKGMSIAEGDLIIKTAHRVIPQFFKSAELGYFFSHKFLENLTHTLMRVAQHKTQLKYKLYSAHDSNILGVFSALKMPLNENPHYASELRFLLYQNTENPENFYVTLIYNESPVKIPGCEMKCRLAKFVDSVSDNMDLSVHPAAK